MHTSPMASGSYPGLNSRSNEKMEPITSARLLWFPNRRRMVRGRTDRDTWLKRKSSSVVRVSEGRKKNADHSDSHWDYGRGNSPDCTQSRSRRVHMHLHLRLRRPRLRHGLQCVLLLWQLLPLSCLSLDASAFSWSSWMLTFCRLRTGKLTSDGAATPEGLIAAALAHGFALFVAVSVGANISGGHVNPAVTFGAFVGGNITLLRGILYWIAQLLGSTAACLLLRFSTGGLETGTFGLSGVSVWEALVLEIVMTFGLVYTVYATAVDPKKGSLGTIAPIAIGFIVGANILVGGPFDGASMNPAVSFGPALVSWSWTHQWVYWLGPLIGGALAGLVYEIFFISHSHEQLPTADY
ncbi:hypothetical protein BHE74_00051270 [Ensete ventricosum]|nr:hypothetical protein BHE74_00051270 [Ensete ventricosum]